MSVFVSVVTATDKEEVTNDNDVQWKTEEVTSVASTNVSSGT